MKINTTIMSKKGNIKLSYEIPDYEYYKVERLKRKINVLKILDINNLCREKLLYYNEEYTKEIERIEQKYNPIELTYNRIFKYPTKNFLKKKEKYLSKK